ncbi:MAG TPA: Ig domain-containing protein [Polyangiaceae bacterium]|nr:Ig domain-containing protein [Polyangiaceae bacterium]
MAGASDAGMGGEAGAEEGGSAGRDAQAGEAGTANDAGAGGMAGDSSVSMDLEIAQPILAVGKTYVPFTGKISASGAAHYTWSLTSGALPAGLTLQGAKSATLTIAGTPTEAGQFPIGLTVTDGSITKSVDVTLAVTHSALFLSDRNVAGVNELFVAEVGAGSAAAPVRLSASIPSGGGVSSYAWSPDGSKVLYLATQSSGGATELWVASLATPRTVQRVSAPGATVSTMVWLGEGNVAAYSTSVGDTYLAELSEGSPGSSKLAISGHGSAAVLRASPNGVSLGVNLNNEAIHTNEISYVTWAPGGVTVVLLLKAQGAGPYFSYDGRYAMINDGPSASWLDLSLPGPLGNNIPSGNGVGISWSPHAESLFMVVGGGSAYSFGRGDFTAAGMTTASLATANDCGGAVPVRWSPDAKNGLYGCAADVRGIGNLATAVAGTDFSLLPSGLLSKAFTDTPSIDWSPDSKWVALRADRDVDAQYDLYLVRWSAPGVAYKPHTNSIAPGVTTWAFAENSQSIAFVGTIAPQSNAGLYLSKLPVSGAPPIGTLVSAPASSVVQNDINWLPGSRMIAYRATVSGASQLFAVPVSADGTAGSPLSISGVSGTGVSSYQLAPTR